jgi:ParB family transcriptional regulator, chromosome partitioning protein
VNIRTDARLDKDFVASIKDFGVLVPVIAVRTAGGDVRVRFGHRRTLAAIQADLGTVPVEIVGDEATDDAGQSSASSQRSHFIGSVQPTTP